MGNKRQKPTKGAKRRTSAAGPRPRDDASKDRPTQNVDQLFARLRAGAANVSGVTFQIVVSAWLLAGDPTDGTAPIVTAITPEGLEDIDCLTATGTALLVQTKDRGHGAPAIAAAELAGIIAHAAPALFLDDAATFALVTNGRFGSGVVPTGFTTTLSAANSVDAVDGVREALRKEATGDGTKIDADVDVDALLARTHLVVVDGDISDATVRRLADTLAIDRSVAALVRSELLRDLGEVAAAQRGTTVSGAMRRTVDDVHVIATRVMQNVDVPSLDEAVSAGVCEPADFVAPASIDRLAFYAGVDVTPAHIAAGYDVIRAAETTAVLDGLADTGNVVITGPSGSGKSALLWRCAEILRSGWRILRVLRVGDDADVELLIRHVRRQLPTPTTPFIVVSDDLGRDRMAAWPAAHGRLIDIAGVAVLTAVRREDLTPGLTTNATVVDPQLTDSSARLVYDTIAEMYGAPAMAFQEAVAAGGGLLMEFIALVTTGRRIREVLAQQVDVIGRDPLRREALRIVAAAHMLGSAVHADRLPNAIGASPAQVGDALRRLAGEHLVISDGSFWHGLHDLRTEILFDLVHDAPPPTPGATYAAVLPLLPAGAQAAAARRAAVRVARTIGAERSEPRPHDTLNTILDALEPVAGAIRDLIAAASAAPSEDAAAHVAGLLEAGDRLDTVAYVHAALPFFESNRPPTAALGHLATITYSAAVGGLTFDGPLQRIGDLAKRMPTRQDRSAAVVTSRLGSGELAALAIAAPKELAIRLCEAAEVAGGELTSDDAEAVHRHHAGRLPEPAGSGPSRRAGDLRAQVTATLAGLARLRGSQVAASFGPVEARAAEAVASDDFGAFVRLEREADTSPSSSELARRWTFAPGEVLIAAAAVFARGDDQSPPETAYRAEPGKDGRGINDQAVLLIRRLLDSCPEVDVADVEVWRANGRPVEIDGHKRIRAGVLPRAVNTARAVAFEAAMNEALGAEHWSRRLREQAMVAAELTDLLCDVPRRAETNDNARRRRDWCDRVRAAAEAVATLPARPVDRPAILGAAHRAALQVSAAAVDDELRRHDRAKSALESVAGALLQVATNLGSDRRLVTLAGNQLADVPGRMEQARGQGAPVFSGVGSTLPPAIDTSAVFAAEVLTGLAVPEIARAVDRARGDTEAIDTAIEEASLAAASSDATAVRVLLEEQGVTTTTDTALDGRRIVPWRRHQAVLLVPLEDWAVAVRALQSWDPADRSELVSGRVVVAVTEGDELFPFALAFYGSGGVLPMPEDDVRSLADGIPMPCRDSRFRSKITQASVDLVAASYEGARASGRDPAWSRPSRGARPPTAVATELRASYGSLLDRADEPDVEHAKLYAAAAVALLLDLCAVVEDEDPATGLAAQLAEIDIRALAALEEGPAAALFDAAHVAALEAGPGPDVEAG